ncbi:ATP-binding protein [Streptomyces sp. NBC_00887]|uniref:ATP-binding protein n=1 Tax=Streptomyces sp. NBC_00887 TaxID=2975859 RepID=UPI00386EAF99|nr:winged helix-turn-helix domain-containing protein [Streptomyces sp. NBC_00887]
MQYLILGATEARDEQGDPLPVGGTRLRALLAALALRAGRPVSVAALVDDVWAGDPPNDAPAALQALVGRLRRALGRAAVTGTPGGYRLEAGRDDVDLYVFERLARQGAAELDSGDPESAARTLRAALALWRGPALADLRERDHGIRAEADRMAAIQQRIEADLRRGVPRGLVPELRELTAAHPYDEPLHAQLLRALRAEGRQADALVAYEEARRALADGLGTGPGPELTALHRELLDHAGPSALGAPAHPHPPEGNLRPRLTSFVGREPELLAIRADLTRARLVTLTGPGGSGKTRLAEESAAGQGAWIAELAPLDDPSAVPGAVLSALGLRETTLLRDSAHDRPTAAADPTERLVEHLSHRSRNRPFLLVLDNCEHVVDAAAALAETLLTHCPRLRILATSREPLGVPGEAVRPVGPLPPHPAHRLFAERARAVRPDFRPDEGTEGKDAEDSQVIAEICRRLDGLPLAIELAAARLRMLTPRQIADRLDDRFRLLSSGSRTVLPRQQTLRAVVDWSWDLLSEGERTVLRQISVFAGGWDLSAAEAVTRSPDAASLLGALVDKSLVVATPTDAGEMRYRLLETIHEYASERAAETPDVRAAAAAAHTACFAALAEKADSLLRSGAQLPWISRLEADLDNIRAALHRTVATEPSERDALRLVLNMGWFWWLRNFRNEGAAWADRAAGLGEDPDDPADPRYWPRKHLHMLRFFLTMETKAVAETRDDEEIHALVRCVTEAFGSGGPQAARFPGLFWPLTSYMRGEFTEDVRGHFDATVANTREYGGDWEYGVTLMFRTHMLVDAPHGMTGIDEDLAELRTLSRRIGDRYLRAQVASAAAEAGMMRGRYDESRVAYQEALELAREVGAHAEAPFLLGRLAELDYLTGDLDAARKGLDEAEAEAERQHVLDAHAFVNFLRASIALAAGEIPAARRFADSARGAQVYGPPPQFAAALLCLSARISVYEPSGGPAVGLRGITDGLRMAVEAGCANVFTAYLGEAAGITLPRLGQYAAAARLLAASRTWRGGGPRSVLEEAEVAEVLEELREKLGPLLYDEERAAGSALTPQEAVELLTGITEELSDS